jgi:hypothetical protein
VTVIGKCTDPTLVGPTPVRRLSRLEYFNAVRDVFGVEVNQGDLPSEDTPLGRVFTANIQTPMTADQFTRYDTAAKAVATEVAANLQARSGCAAADSACIQTFLTDKARQAFHGVLEQGDRQRLLDLYAAVSATDAMLGVRTAVRWILESPRFLYTVEFGTPEGTLARLSQGEIAGRLASFLWRSVPDTELLRAADANELTGDGIRQQATRMLGDARSEPVLRAFITELLGLSPSAGADALNAAIDAEAGNVFVAAAKGAGTYAELFTSRQSRGTAELAQFYGTTLGADGSMTVPAERQGLLLRAAFMRSHIKGDMGSPTQRGKQVREALLCDPVQLPVDNVNMNIPPPEPGQTVNDVFNLHGSAPECVGCHSMMDPIGFAFGEYGPDGVFNASLASSTAGAIHAGSANLLELAFDNRDGLIQALATNVNPQQCFVIQMNRFALGRAETVADACGLTDVWDAFLAGNSSLQTLLVEVAVGQLMQVRNVVRPGETCR